MNPGHKQLIQIALVALLLIGCIAVLLPFTGTLLFAVVICVTTLPIRNRLLTLCGGRSNLAALLVSILLLMLLVAPMALLSGSLADGVEMAIRYFKPLMEGGLPADPPAWLVRLPIIGRDAAAYWHELIESREEMNNLLHQFVDPTRRLALSAASLLAQIERKSLPHVIAAHLSEKNNTTALARSALAAVLQCDPEWVGIATQAGGLDWRDVRN